MASLLLLISTLIFLIGVACSQQTIFQSTTPTYWRTNDDQIIPKHDNNSYCESWKFSIEANDDVNWTTYPTQCKDYIMHYMSGDRYLSDSEMVTTYALEFAKTVNVLAKDAWIFDVDETLLSNSPFHKDLSLGSYTSNDQNGSKIPKLPALPASLKLYKEIEGLGFKIFILTGRWEIMRKDTVQNLHSVGYKNWARLILRQQDDENKTAIVYKSERRVELEKEGYKIQGSVGDQWSDLWGNATAIRSFKLPNPLYYVA